MLVIGSWQYSGGLSGFHSVGGGHDGLKRSEERRVGKEC